MDANTHTFTLFLTGIEDITDTVGDKLFEAGCDDGTLGMCEGVVSINFDREAESLSRAIYTACEDVRKAGFDVNRVVYE